METVFFYIKYSIDIFVSSQIFVWVTLNWKKMKMMIS